MEDRKVSASTTLYAIRHLDRMNSGDTAKMLIEAISAKEGLDTKEGCKEILIKSIISMAEAMRDVSDVSTQFSYVGAISDWYSFYEMWLNNPKHDGMWTRPYSKMDDMIKEPAVVEEKPNCDVCKHRMTASDMWPCDHCSNCFDSMFEHK